MTHGLKLQAFNFACSTREDMFIAVAAILQWQNSYNLFVEQPPSIPHCFTFAILFLWAVLLTGQVP